MTAVIGLFQIRLYRRSGLAASLKPLYPASLLEKFSVFADSVTFHAGSTLIFV
jgi:hypothetical protein